MKFDIVEKLTTCADLCVASYEQACKQLAGTPYYIIGGEEQLQSDVIEAIIKNNGVVGFQVLPTEILRNDYCWCLTGRRNPGGEAVCILGYWL